MPIVDLEMVSAYIKLVKHGKPVTVREFQRLMKYSSPGKAQRMLEKLVREGLAVRNSDNELRSYPSHHLRTVGRHRSRYPDRIHRDRRTQRSGSDSRS